MEALKTNFQKIQVRFLATTEGMTIDEELWAKFNPLSSNKVTGDSINFPVAGTCQPSKVCAQTCCALRGPIVWPASDRHKNSLNLQGSALLIEKFKKQLKPTK